MHSISLVKEAAQAYATDIQSGNFPDNEAEAFGFPEELLPDLASFYDQILKQYE
jgi:hypothetical protein